MMNLRERLWQLVVEDDFVAAHTAPPIDHLLERLW